MEFIYYIGGVFIKNGYFYFINDKYFSDFPDPMLMKNTFLHFIEKVLKSFFRMYYQSSQNYQTSNLSYKNIQSPFILYYFLYARYLQKIFQILYFPMHHSALFVIFILNHSNLRICIVFITSGPFFFYQSVKRIVFIADSQMIF